MFHFLQFRSNLFDARLDLDEAPALLHGGHKRDGLIDCGEGLTGLFHGNDEGGGLSLSGLLTGDEEPGEFVNVGKSDTELLLSVVEKLGGVDDALTGGSSGAVVVLDLGSVFREKLVALSSLHVVGFVGLGLFVSDLLGELVDQSEDITNHSISGKVKL